MGAGLVLSLLLPASSVLAANGETQRKADEKPDIVLHGEATSAWSLATSGSVLVDGRLVGTQDRLENGSRIVVDARSTARAEIKDVGRIQLSPRTEVVLDMIDDTIVAKMIQGSMRVEVAARYSRRRVGELKDGLQNRARQAELDDDTDGHQSQAFGENEAEDIAARCSDGDADPDFALARIDRE